MVGRRAPRRRVSVSPTTAERAKINAVDRNRVTAVGRARVVFDHGKHGSCVRRHGSGLGKERFAQFNHTTCPLRRGIVAVGEFLRSFPLTTSVPPNGVSVSFRGQNGLGGCGRAGRATLPAGEVDDGGRAGRATLPSGDDGGRAGGATLPTGDVAARSVGERSGKWRGLLVHALLRSLLEFGTRIWSKVSIDNLNQYLVEYELMIG